MVDHLDDTALSNSKIAAEAGVCESYLRRMFRENYKTTPKQYVIEARIQKAGQALRENRDRSLKSPINAAFPASITSAAPSNSIRA